MKYQSMATLCSMEVWQFKRYNKIKFFWQRGRRWEETVEKLGNKTHVMTYPKCLIILSGWLRTRMSSIPSLQKGCNVCNRIKIQSILRYVYTNPPYTFQKQPLERLFCGILIDKMQGIVKFNWFTILLERTNSIKLACHIIRPCRWGDL